MTEAAVGLSKTVKNSQKLGVNFLIFKVDDHHVLFSDAISAHIDIALFLQFIKTSSRSTRLAASVYLCNLLV